MIIWNSPYNSRLRGEILQNGCLSSENLKEEIDDSLIYYDTPVPGSCTLSVAIIFGNGAIDPSDGDPSVESNGTLRQKDGLSRPPGRHLCGSYWTAV